MRNKLLCVLVLLLFPAILLASALSLPDLYQESYYAELAPMTERLEQAEGRKLVLIGGSNIAFGVDGNLLQALLREHGFDYTVCPYGFYAAVGSDAMLSLSEHALREGDIVVLAVEPASEAFSDYFGATAFLKCAEGHPSLLASLSGSQRSRIIGNAIPYLQEKASIVRSGVYPKAEGVYSKAAFDESCTMVYDRPGNQMTLGYDASSPIDLDAFVIQPAFAEHINRYCRLADEKGAAVCMSFSPMNRSAVSGSLSGHFALLNTSFDCPVISDPGRYVLDSGWFYDSNFHLNSAGQTLRTCLLAEDLLAYLGCYDPLDVELPLMPAPVRAEAVNQAAQAEADAAGSADFLTEPLADGAFCRITGLTDHGKAQQILAIPASVGGRTVVYLTEDALDGADSLEELQIPATVETLPDYLMSHVPSLKRLVLLHTDAPCGLRPHSLDGAEQLRIFVPAEAWPRYRDGYGCEENPWQPYINQIYTW